MQSPEEYAIEVIRWLEALGRASGDLKPGDGPLAVVGHNAEEVARAYVGGVSPEACARELLVGPPNFHRADDCVH